jgi:hypothetical protein
MLLYLRQQGCEFNEETMARAAAHDHLAVCQFLVREQCRWDFDACTEAATGGHLETIRFLHASGCPWPFDLVCSNAVSGGNIELLQYLKQQGYAFGAGAMNAAAYAGHTHICEYLRAEQCAWGDDACKQAALGSQLDTLRWLHKQGYPLDIQKVRMAAARTLRPGTSVLKYLTELGTSSKLSTANTDVECCRRVQQVLCSRVAATARR